MIDSTESPPRSNDRVTPLTGHDTCELTLDEHVIAVASDTGLSLPVPVLDLNDTDGMVSFIQQWMTSR